MGKHMKYKDDNGQAQQKNQILHLDRHYHL